MTRQETFNTVVAHLRQQGRQAVNSGGRQCQYRGEDGLKCAAGCLIPDEDYRKDFEGRGVMTNTEIATLIRRLGHDVELVSSLQDIHDDDRGPACWESHFVTTAARFNLVYTPKEVA